MSVSFSRSAAAALAASLGIMSFGSIRSCWVMACLVGLRTFPCCRADFLPGQDRLDRCFQLSVANGAKIPAIERGGAAIRHQQDFCMAQDIAVNLIPRQRPSGVIGLARCALRPSFPV